MSEAVIQARDLTRRFGDFLAVDAVSFEICAGEVVGYLGPNGSGKTTTIRMLLGLLRPSQGSASVLGCDTVRQVEQLRQQVGYMSQKFSLYHDLSVWENLQFYAGVYGVTRRSRLEEVIEMIGLRGQERQLVRQLSVGWRQRLALGAAIVHQPRLLFLDEPTSGVDPRARRAFWELIYTLVGQGVTAFVTTHYMDEAEYCERIGIMRSGRLLALDTPQSLMQRVLPGGAWEVIPAAPPVPGQEASLLLRAYEILAQAPGVLRVGLSGDRLRLALAPSATHVDPALFSSLFQAVGLAPPRLLPVEPTLEDVFLALAARGAD